MSVRRVSIEDHPGFWRQGKSVCFKYRDERGRQVWGYASTIRAAKRKKAQLETDVARGEHQRQSRETFKAYARSCIETYQGRTRRAISEASRRDYLRKLERHGIPFFGSMRLADVRPQDIKAFARHVAGLGVAPDTLRLALAPVKIVFATAYEEGLIRTNPAAGVRVAVPEPQVDPEDIDEDDGPVKAMSEAELARLLDVLEKGSAEHELAPHPEWRPFFEALADLGLRISEAIELRWSDVDLGERTVHVRRKFYDGEIGRPKSRYGRRKLRLTEERARALWELRKETRAGDNDLVFAGPRGGRIVASNLAARVLKPAARVAGLEWVGFHTFRHTCATTLFRRRWNAKQVQRWLGHHKASFTLDTYIHLLDGDIPEPLAIAPARVHDLEHGAERAGPGGAAAGHRAVRDAALAAPAGA